MWDPALRQDCACDSFDKECDVRVAEAALHMRDSGVLRDHTWVDPRRSNEPVAPFARKNCNEAKANRPNTLPRHRQCRPAMLIVASQMTRLELRPRVARRTASTWGGVHTGRCRRVWEFVVGAQAARHNLLEGEEKATPTFHVRSRHTHTQTRSLVEPRFRSYKILQRNFRCLLFFPAHGLCQCT